MSDAIITAIAGTIGAIIIAFLGFYSSKKFKIGQAQEKLVETLQALVEAQEKKIADLTEELQKANARIHALEQEVETLKGLTITQALEIQDNKDQLETLAAKPQTSRRRISNV